MQRLFFAFILVVVAAFGIANAWAADVLRPRVDYRATYRIEPDGESLTMTHHGGLIRLDARHEGEDVAMIMDMKKRIMLMLSETGAMRMDMDQPLPGAQTRSRTADWATDVSLRPTALGTKEILGHQCTVYDAICGAGTGRPVRSRVCLTDDLVMLESISQDRGREFHMIATALDIAPQDPALFRAPPGIEVLDMSQMIRGLPGMPLR